MTKIYCPKGHENKLYPDIHCDRLGKLWNVLICNDSECYRPYFEIDCITEPKEEKIIALKDFVTPLKPASLSFDPLEEQWVNPKRESQVAIERVIEALIKVSQSEDVNIATHSNILDALIHELEFDELEEINK